MGVPVGPVHVVDGRTVDAGAGRVCWWEPTTPGAYRRMTGVHAIVLHHTGGEGGPAQVYRTLRTRGLSIHYVVSSDGTIVQMADPVTTATQHAGPPTNGRSIGIEVVCRGTGPALPGHPRDSYRDRVHGRGVGYLAWHPAQLDAVAWLVRDLAAAHGVPLGLPLGPGGRVSRHVLEPAVVAGWRGILGHYHITRGKVDPGPRELDQLHDRWAVGGG